MAKRIPKALYHYCSVDTFFSIIKNRSIWLSDISKSNDSKELQWLKAQCEVYVLKGWVNYIEELDKIGQMQTADFERFKETQKLSDLINKNEISKCWVFCLSEKRDDLGQWRGYADDGCGISIGFKSDFFRIVEVITKLIDENEEIYFQKVKYSQKQIEDFFLNYANLKDITVNTSSDEVIDRLEKAIILTMWNAAFFKCETFKEEKEWRIAYLMDVLKLAEGKVPGIPEDKNEYKNAITLGNYDFAVKNKTLVSHVELGIPHIETIITEICIGPKSPLEVKDVKLFLISQGMLKSANDTSIKVYKSNATYR